MNLYIIQNSFKQKTNSFLIQLLYETTVLLDVITLTDSQ